MDIATIDFETYYDKDYSLSKMTTEAYVRDPRFEVIGVGIKINDYPTDWYSGSDPGRFLKQLDYSTMAILCHNTVFDGAILSWHFGIKPKLWLDTLSMARPLHNISVGGSLKALATYYKLGEKGDEVVNAIGKRRADFTPPELERYASYCCNDVELTHKLFRKMAKGFPASEIGLIDQTIRMYTEPSIVIDTGALAVHLDEVVNKKLSLVDELHLPPETTEEQAKALLMSNALFANYLTAFGVDPPTKTSLATGKQTYAFSKSDKAFTNLLEHDNPSVVAAISARLGVKSTLEETRTKSLMGVAERGALPIMLNYYGAHTGRFSGGDKMNLQNLPRGGALRRSLCVPEGKVLVACDSSQIEARLVAWVAGQRDLIQQFADKRDVYSEFASDIYGRKITKADKVERHIGKTAVLGLGYGMGAEKFRGTLSIGAGGIKVDLTEDEAQRIVRLYREKNFKIAQFWKRCGHALSHMLQGTGFDVSEALPSMVTGHESIRLPNGLSIRYPLLHSSGSDGYSYANTARLYREAVKARVMGQDIPRDKFTRIYGGKVTENCVQALARLVVSDQMTAIGQRYKVVLQVHDEVVIMCDEAEAATAQTFMEAMMSIPPSWAPDLPVSCEAGQGANYGDCK